MSQPKPYRVEVRIPATIVLRGSVRAADQDAALELARSEGERVAEEFEGRGVLEGSWPELLGGARVFATPVQGGSVEASGPEGA